MDSRFIVHEGNCLDVLRTLPDCSIDSVVTDPPYGLSDHKPTEVAACLSAWLQGAPYVPKGKGFMGKSWDAWVPGPEVWRECMRVLKPGGHVLAFAGTRSMDLMSMAVRLAGFELRDAIGNLHEGSEAPLLAWVYGSGFPKSLDVSKAIDKAAGAEREVLSERVTGWSGTLGGRAALGGLGGADDVRRVTAPATDASRQWEGWGTALKPAWEPIILARKPLDGTVVANVLDYGTGALNIDGCRVGGFQNTTPSGVDRRNATLADMGYRPGGYQVGEKTPNSPPGRWPANLIHDGSEAATAAFPQAPGAQAQAPVRGTEPSSKTDNTFGTYGGRATSDQRDGGGSAARFFKQCSSGDIEWLESQLPALVVDSHLCLQRLADAIVQSGAATSALPEDKRLSVVSAPSTAVTPRESRQIAQAAIEAIPTIVSAFSQGLKHEGLTLSRCHVSVVARETPTGITMTTESHSKSDGYAGSITFSITPISSEAGVRGCEQFSTKSRFMYCAKTSSKDRHDGLTNPGPQFQHGATLRAVENADTKGNNHPTVKPTELMRYLCRLVTPPGGVVLDPFTGSGSTGRGAMLEGFQFIGIELDPGYADIARARISAALDTNEKPAKEAAPDQLELI